MAISTTNHAFPKTFTTLALPPNNFPPQKRNQKKKNSSTPKLLKQIRWIDIYIQRERERVRMGCADEDVVEIGGDEDSNEGS